MHQFEKKLHFVFVGRRHDRIASLGTLLRSLHTQCGVLHGRELEFAAEIDANHPEVVGKIKPLRNSWAIKLLVGSAHQDLPCERRSLRKCANLPESSVKADA